MITPELLDFIEAELKAGQTQDGLFRLLKDGGGWTMEDVTEAMVAIEKRKRPVSIAEMRAHSAPTGQASGRPPLLHIPETKKPEPLPPPVIAQAPASHMGEMLYSDGKVPALPPSHQPSPVPQSVPSTPPPTPTVVSSPVAVSSSLPTHSSVKMPEATSHALQPQVSAKEPLHHPVAPLPTFTPVIPPVPVPVPESSATPLRDAKAEVLPAHHGMSLRMPVPSSKKIFVLAGLGVLLGLFGVGAYFLVKGFTPKADKTFATMYASIPGIQTLRYSGETTLNFSGTVADALKANLPAGYMGSAKLALKYDGRADLKKGIDGVHQFGITADLRSGSSALSVNSTVELRIIGDTYYIKITNPPEMKDIDLSRLNTYWIAVSPSDIAKRFGGTLDADGNPYGVFGGATTTPTMRGIIASHPPFDALDRVGEEQLGGASTVHYRFKGNPDNLLELMRFVIATVTAGPWEMTLEEETNWKTLLGSLAGDIWIDSTTYLPRKMVFREPLRGTVSGITLDGALDVEQNYSEYNGTVSVSVPRPVMTYEEFADDVKRQSERVKATGDSRRIFDIEDVVAALEVYRANNNDSYPSTLETLVTSGLLPALPIDPEGESYRYASYVDKTKTTKKYLCTGATSTCSFFHLGVTLSGTTTEVLGADSDIVTETIFGTDSKGCGKEAGKFCYDLTPKK